MISCVVELFGGARRLAGLPQLEVELPAGATLRDVAAALASRSPALFGPVVAPDRRSLVEPYVFNLNGRHFATNLDVQPQPGDHVLLLLMAAGG